MANREQLRQVAQRCSQYNFDAANSFKSSVTNSEKSCENCEHFKNNKCDINLTDEILSNIDEELDY